MEQTTVTLIVAGLGIGGTLTSGILGQTMSRSSQHQQWRRDNVRQECRELLGQLSVNRFSIRDFALAFRSQKTSDDQKQAAMNSYDRDVRDLHRNIGSRIVIAKEIRTVKVAERWQEAVDEYMFAYDEDKLESAFDKLVNDLVDIGLRV